MNEQNPWEEAFPGAGDPGALEALHLRRLGRDRPVRAAASPDPVIAAAEQDPAQRLLVAAYRDRGHLAARLDPLERSEPAAPDDLDPVTHGLDRRRTAPLAERLKNVYCGSLGWEISHIHDPARRRWLQREAETPETGPSLETRRALLDLLVKGHVLEQSMAARLPGAKLFGLGGAESFLAAVETILAESVAHGIEEVVIGGMHRGRFNLLANIVGKPLPSLVAEITGRPWAPSGLRCSGDVSYHLGYGGTREIDGRTVRFSVSPHPSHLQLVPVLSLGRARAKQTARGGVGQSAVLPLLLHSDAGFSGQGIMMETFQLAKLKPYDVGGAIHVIINNQVGFTTDPEEGRSSRYCSDIGRIAEAPVLHVNGDDVDAVWRAATTAARYRAAFGSDVVLDLVCYRRPGHNEIDEPRFTQPAMVRAIAARQPVHELYRARLAGDGYADGAAEFEAKWRDEIRQAFDAARSYEPNAADCFGGAWESLRAGEEVEMAAFAETGLRLERLRSLGRIITSPPRGFSLEPKVRKFLRQRRESIESGEGITWASAEALALASLLAEGTAVRLGGQDTPRGAFTQRHLILHDQETGSRHDVLMPAATSGVRAEVFNTPLAEFGVLAFEYGHSLADPHTLVVWEAQFGDFLNVAQPVFDQCIACGEDRWLRSSGIVLLLPHGIDGGGADHSTARPERLLAACAGGNIQVVNASTPANFFHALRRQMRRPFRKPLVVLAPKALFRHKDCVSRLEAFGPGTGFRHMIADETAREPERTVLCTGKIYYELAAARAERGLTQRVALIRIEQLYPFPADELQRVLGAHCGGEIVWCQEEPRNMGYYEALDQTLERLTGGPVRYAGRPAVATPAVGTKSQLEAELDAVIDAALGFGAEGK